MNHGPSSFSRPKLRSRLTCRPSKTVPRSLPDRQDLAYACALVLVMSQALTDLDFELIGRLYAPEVPVSMFALSKDIADMKARAVAAAEKLSGAHDMPRGPADSSTDGDVPF